MLRSVFTVRHGRIAVAFEGGHVAEVGDPADSNNGGTYSVHHMQHASGSAPSPTATVSAGGDGTQSAASPEVAGKPAGGAAAASGKAGAAAGGGGGGSTTAVDIAYSGDAGLVATATEDKRVRVWRTRVALDSAGAAPAVAPVAGEAEAPAASAAASAAAGNVLGGRELPKKPTSILFAPVTTAGGGAGGGDDKKREEVLVVADKCGDAYAAPLPDPSAALKHLLGHTAMTITAMALLKGGTLLATADRAEHIRVSQFPRTTIVHTYLLGHKDFVSALATVPGSGGVFMLSGGGDGMVGLWDAEAGKELAMISVRQACQDLADGDAASEGLAGMDLEEAGEDEEGGEEEAEAAAGGVAPAAEHRGQENTTGGAGGSSEDGGEEGEGATAAAAAGAAGQGEGVGAGAGGGSSKGDGGGDGDGEGGGGGVPLSVSCSEDGKTVAVVVSGLEGLLLLSLSCGAEGSPAAASLTPRARLQLPSVPIQAGFLDGDLVVALPSASSEECVQAFSLSKDGKGATPADSGSARDKCRSITAWARDQADGGMVLKAAVPDDDASEALGGGLRKHRGTRARNVGNSTGAWNNFSRRRDKNSKKKAKKAKKMKRSAIPLPPAQHPASDGAGAGAATATATATAAVVSGVA